MSIFALAFLSVEGLTLGENQEKIPPNFKAAINGDQEKATNAEGVFLPILNAVNKKFVTPF